MHGLTCVFVVPVYIVEPVLDDHPNEHKNVLTKKGGLW